MDETDTESKNINKTITKPTAPKRVTAAKDTAVKATTAKKPAQKTKRLDTGITAKAKAKTLAEKTTGTTKKAVPTVAKVKQKKQSVTEKINPDKSIKGSILIRRIWKKMIADGISPYRLASDYLGMAYTYLMALGRGTAKINQLKIEQYMLMANYLDIPLIQVMLLAEAIQPEDFFYKATVEERVEHVYEMIKNDPLFMGFAPSQQDWNSASPTLKLSFCVMYETSAQSKILNPMDLVRVTEKD